MILIILLFNKMISATLLILTIGVVIIDCIAQTIVRLYWENKDRFYLMLVTWAIYFGAISILVLMYDYSKIAIANALWDSGSIVCLSLIGYFYFGEPLNVGEIIGMSIVIIGSLVIGFTAGERAED